MSAQRTVTIISNIIAIIAILTLIIGRINDNKNLDRIIYNAKKEAENTLASTGRMIYAEDVGNIVGAGPVSALNENLPENTEINPQPEGTIVKPKENWNIETVTAVSVGNGDTVPVPIGFYYVGGDLNTGVIISDEEVDKYDGITDKTTWEYTTELKGNQFVWIPCTEEEYVKCNVWNGITQNSSTLASTNWNKSTNSSELPQIRKYEGFYVARYEAGLSAEIAEYTSAQPNTTSNQVYNIDKVNEIPTKPQAKAGVIPWMFIDWNHAYTNAKNMYNTSSISSGLITGTEWDVMLNAFVGKKKSDGTELTDADLKDSSSWGNYASNSIEYRGRKAREYLSGRWYLGAFGQLEESKTAKYSNNGGDLLTTGASKQTEVYHIYDVAGNLAEVTEEIGEVSTRVIRRGGCCDNDLPAVYREGTYEKTYTSNVTGFRVVLYIK